MIPEFWLIALVQAINWAMRVFIAMSLLLFG